MRSGSDGQGLDPVIKVPITAKEAEGIMWVLAHLDSIPDRPTEGVTDPLYVLLEEGFARADIVRTAAAMEDSVCATKWITGPLNDLEKAILRVCVEQTNWIRELHAYEDLAPLIEPSRAALRSLAQKLEAFDIEVNHMPSD